MFNSVVRSAAAMMTSSWVLVVLVPLSVELFVGWSVFRCRFSRVEEDSGFGGLV